MVAALRNSRKKNITKKAVSNKKEVKTLNRRTRSKTIEVDLNTLDPNGEKVPELEEVKVDENGDEIGITEPQEIDNGTESEIAKPTEICERIDEATQYEAPKICSHCGAIDSVSWRNGPSDFPCLCITCSVSWKKGKILLAYKHDSPSPNLHTVFLQDSAPAVVPESVFASFSTVEKAETNSHEYYVSDFAVPLPKKFACPTVTQEKAEESYFYPCPMTLTEPEDRLEYLLSKLEEIDSCQLAQMLLLLDTDTRNEFDRAIKIKKDASLDVSCLDDATWSSLCGLFVQH